MSKYARLHDNVIIEITTVNPAGRFHPSVQWFTVPDHVDVHWSLFGGEYLPPPEPIPPEPPAPIEPSVWLDSLVLFQRLTDPEYDDIYAKLSARQKVIFLKAEQFDRTNAELVGVATLVCGAERAAVILAPQVA